MFNARRAQNATEHSASETVQRENDYLHTVTEIRQVVKLRTLRIPFEDMASEVLSQRYVLSLVICGDTLARRINRMYRKKDYSPNVLSFPLGEYEGEIFLNMRKAEREAKAAGISARERVALLFAHGCLHLRGLKHGTEMEKLEENTLKKFGF